MIVVDTNILCLRWLPASETSLADELFERDAEWGSALLWRWEFRNAMVGYIRRGSLTATVAGQLCGKAQATLSGREFSSSPQAVFELVSKSSCTAYDCEFVAVAREQGVPLVTMDKQVLREFPHLATSLPDFLAH